MHSEKSAAALCWLVSHAADARDLTAFVPALLEHLCAASGAVHGAVLLEEGPAAARLFDTASDSAIRGDPDEVRGLLGQSETGSDDHRVRRPFRLRDAVGTIVLDGVQRSDDAEAAITAALPVVDLVASLTVARREASHDPLTGLANRRLMADRLGGAIEEGNRYQTTFALAMLDMNNFKWFNDTYGHAEGDELLRAFASVLSSGLRRADVVARYGGDEFVLLLPHTTNEEALVLLGRIDAELKTFLDRYQPGSVRLGFSLGVAHFPEDGHDADTLVRRADERLYQDKLRSGVQAQPPRG